MPAYHVGREIEAKGPLSTVVAACATGTQAIGDGAEWIRRGAADIVVVGGAEGLIYYANVVGFIAMRGLSLRNDEPERASRPFDADRDGFVIGEGAGILVLERLEHALGLGAGAIKLIIKDKLSPWPPATNYWSVYPVKRLLECRVI